MLNDDIYKDFLKFVKKNLKKSKKKLDY